MSSESYQCFICAPQEEYKSKRAHKNTVVNALSPLSLSAFWSSKAETSKHSFQ